MGIYKNSDIEPNIYHLDNNEITSNQKEYRKNYLQEILLEQAKMNDSLKHSVEHVSQSLQLTNAAQQDQNKFMIHKLHSHDQFYERIEDYFQNQEKTNEFLLQRLTLLEEKNEAILEKIEAERLLTEAILDQQSIHDQVLHKLKENIDEEESVIDQLKKQDDLFDEFSSKLELQQIFHNTVMERLDQQEGLMKKIIGELDHLRSVIYERAAHIAEKIEDQYHRITKPIQHFIVKKDTKEKVD